MDIEGQIFTGDDYTHKWINDETDGIGEIDWKGSPLNIPPNPPPNVGTPPAATKKDGELLFVSGSRQRSLTSRVNGRLETASRIKL